MRIVPRLVEGCGSCNVSLYLEFCVNFMTKLHRQTCNIEVETREKTEKHCKAHQR